MSWPLAAAFIEWYLLFDQGRFDGFAVNHKANQVRHASRDAVILAGLAANRPTHPALGGCIDRVLEVGAGMQTVVHVISKVATVAAVEKGPD